MMLNRYVYFGRKLLVRDIYVGCNRGEVLGYISKAPRPCRHILKISRTARSLLKCPHVPTS